MSPEENRKLPFYASGLVLENRGDAGATLFTLQKNQYQNVDRSSASLLIGANVNVIGSSDPFTQEFINGLATAECNPTKHTAQNEFSIAINRKDPLNLIIGANDYRLYNPVSNRYDGSGGYFRSTDGGLTWTTGLLPGLVQANTENPGPYQTAGDPAIASGPNNIFWYSNIAFNRTDDANSVAVSRSTDGGETWKTTYVVQTSSIEGEALFNDKPWIAAHPKKGKIAYVTWTEFRQASSTVVYSRTSDGGRTWSSPRAITDQILNQGSVAHVDGKGKLHVVWINYDNATARLSYVVKTSGASQFGPTRIIASIDILPQNLSWGSFRTPTLPSFALDGKELHVVWNEWNGKDSDILYIRSPDLGKTWSSPVIIDDGPSDQFFPWVSASKGFVHVAYLNHYGVSGNSYHAYATASEDHGATWTVPVRISTKKSKPGRGNLFRHPECSQFIGDYIGIATDSDGVAHPVWPDIRLGNSTGKKADQDPYTTSIILNTN
ncbi:glycoside hydrolase [bacterium]|nr:glycoside hydrolase [bacterium]